MQKKIIQEMFMDDDERKNQIIFYSAIIIVLSLICIFFTFYTLKMNRARYVSYNEDSDVHYKVYLKDNEFFDQEYLEENQQYIASVIDNIDADFHYHIGIGDKDVHYYYQYKIKAFVDVLEKNSGNSLFHYEDELVPLKEYIDNYATESDVLENVKIDYHKYNDMIRKFIEVYDLDNIDSTLSVQMIIDVGTDVKADTNQSIISLDVPLTLKTVAIDIDSTAVSSKGNVLVYHKRESLIFLLVCLILFCVDVMVIVRFVQFSMNSRSVRDVYEQKLRKILTNYRSYIQKIDNEFEFRGYQVLYVNEFTDLLEIRETISEPILMACDPNNKATFFIVPSSTKILYVYSIRIKDIKRELKVINEL